MTQQPDGRVPIRNITPINYRSGDTTPLHPVGATDHRIDRLLPAGLVVGAAGAAALFGALVTQAFLASALLVLLGGVLVLAAGVILWVWAAVHRDAAASADPTVEDWQRWDR